MNGLAELPPELLAAICRLRGLRSLHLVGPLPAGPTALQQLTSLAALEQLCLVDCHKQGEPSTSRGVPVMPAPAAFRALRTYRLEGLETDEEEDGRDFQVGGVAGRLCCRAGKQTTGELGRSLSLLLLSRRSSRHERRCLGAPDAPPLVPLPALCCSWQGPSTCGAATRAARPTWVCSACAIMADLVMQAWPLQIPPAASTAAPAAAGTPSQGRMPLPHHQAGMAARRAAA